MKIILHSVQDLHELMALLAPKSPAAQELPVTNNLAWYELPAANDSEGPESEALVVSDDASEAPESEGPSEVDIHGIPWNAAIHSSSRTFNKDGSWRAQRGVAKNVIAAVEAAAREEMQAGGPEPEVADVAEEVGVQDVVTETHALPITVDVEPLTDGFYDDLAARAAELAPDTTDSLIDTLNSGKVFIEAYGVAKFHDLKNAIVGHEAIQNLQPDERRLLNAALALYKA